MMQGIKNLLRPKVVFYVGLAYSIFLTILLLSPAQDIPVPIEASDKVAHIAVFFFLTLIWLLYFKLKSGNEKMKPYWTPFVILIYGIIIEIIQGLLIASRTADGWDILANSVGILVGWFVFERLWNLFVLKS